MGTLTTVITAIGVIQVITATTAAVIIRIAVAMDIGAVTGMEVATAMLEAMDIEVGMLMAATEAGSAIQVALQAAIPLAAAMAADADRRLRPVAKSSPGFLTRKVAKRRSIWHTHLWGHMFTSKTGAAFAYYRV